MKLTGRMAILAVGLGLAVPAAASAGTATFAADVLTVTGDPVAETISITQPTGTSAAVTGVAIAVVPGGCVAITGGIQCTGGVAPTVAVNAGAGADTITSPGDDQITIHGDAGNDTITLSTSVIDSTPAVDGGADNDRIVMEGNAAFANGSQTGGPGNDTLVGGTRSDAFLPEPGADTYIGQTTPVGPIANPGFVLFGQSGLDSINYSSSPSAVSVSTDGVANDGVAGESDNVGRDVTYITGSDFADTIDLTAAARNGFVMARLGDDTVTGSLHDDVILGGGGADRVAAGAVNDAIEGQPDLGILGTLEFASETTAAADTYDGGPGDDMLLYSYLAPSAATSVGTIGPDVFIGGSGEDTVQLSALVCPTTSCPSLAGVVGAPVAVSLDDVANDGVAGQGANIRSDIERVIGGDGDDTLVGNDASNVLSGGRGNDTIDGRGGMDSIDGGPGVDTITSRDQLTDRVDCGSDVDNGVTGDTIDLLIGCEGANSLVAPPAAPVDLTAPTISGPGFRTLRLKTFTALRGVKLTVRVNETALVSGDMTAPNLLPAAVVRVAQARLPAATGARTLTFRLSAINVKRVVAKAKSPTFRRVGFPLRIVVTAVDANRNVHSRVMVVSVKP